MDPSAITTAPTFAPPTAQQVHQRPADSDLNDLCPVHESIKIVGRKWHLIILWELSKKPRGFNELKGSTNGISAKMLSQSLSELEEHELVVRDILSERPLRVAYRLTQKAQELSEVFAVLYGWGTRHGLCDTQPAD